MKENFQAFIGLSEENNNRTQVYTACKKKNYFLCNSNAKNKKYLNQLHFSYCSSLL
jgi:hypothetical protein